MRLGFQVLKKLNHAGLGLKAKIFFGNNRRTQRIHFSVENYSDFSFNSSASRVQYRLVFGFLSLKETLIPTLQSLRTTSGYEIYPSSLSESAMKTFGVKKSGQSNRLDFVPPDSVPLEKIDSKSHNRRDGNYKT